MIRKGSLYGLADCVLGVACAATALADPGWMNWAPLPPLPTGGVAGPFVGISENVLIAAGGTDFPVADGQDRWTASKVWHDEACVLSLSEGAVWQSGFRLSRLVAQGAAVSTPGGVVCIGGNDEKTVFSRVFILCFENGQLREIELPDLPRPCASGSAALIGNTVYLAGGLSGNDPRSAMTNFWSLDLSLKETGGDSFRWTELPVWPGPERAFNLTLAQHNGFETCVYVMSGRRTGPDGRVEALRDVWEFSPSRKTWRRRVDSPVPMMAGTGTAVGQSHLFVVSGDDGALMDRTDELKDEHPGFPRKAWAYHTITDTWTPAGAIPCNQVATPAVRSGNRLLLVSGEVRPRVRTNQCWSITFPSKTSKVFGAVDFSVLGAYLLAMVGVGVWFTRRNKNTNDYFRGGQQVPWWVAGCSIFATMLSSITFMAIPAKAYAQNWILLLGNLMIPLVAPLAVYLALPFFRRMDATSAYEYLETRFNRPVRMLASGLFTTFHLFRMGIVLSLAGLALAALTPLTPVQSVLIGGVLCVLYSTMGGLLAVVWTDTIQTFVLLGGALLCFLLVVFNTDGGLGGIVQVALADGKLHFADWDFSMLSYTTAAVWVVVLGGIGQNTSSYLGDQALIQRYVSTPDRDTAARSIWLNAIMVIPASFLFFGIGTALYVFYKSRPELLDPTLQTDQIFPLFISTRLPVGIAGLVVAGIFAAAQSTISTSMNSTAATVVTDFLRPFRLCRSEQGYFRAGQILNLGFGSAGTLLGLLFVRPEITSLFDSFLTVIGLFMGLLGGVFLLGMCTRRANGTGALAGMILAAGLLFALRSWTAVHWLLFAPIGIATCFCAGYLISCFVSENIKE